MKISKSKEWKKKHKRVTSRKVVKVKKRREKTTTHSRETKKTNEKCVQNKSKSGSHIFSFFISICCVVNKLNLLTI